ncbi:MAG: bifunctional phosphoribosylaminoimidazolecarboxamide formyltransferase/IMP cyclohydrolase [Candidatus Melainabacteria bacterium]
MPASADLAQKKVAFLSVFDKTGLEPLARALVEEFGYTLLSTGGTKKLLADKGIPAIESSEITGFDALLGGRVKSLHPSIFAGILAERDKAGDLAYTMPDFVIDTVVVNLYPFEQERDQQAFVPGAADPYHLLHFIDIGGSALIRAGAKNYPSVNVLCEAGQYDEFLAAMRAGQGETSEPFRRQLAVTAFERSVRYEAAIAAQLAGEQPLARAAQTMSDHLVLPLTKIQDLRYGENPHQKAALYGLDLATDFECLHGKELSFNNMLDLQAAWNIIQEFEAPAATVIKHNNPTGAAVAKTLADAYRLAFDTDPVSAFGGIVAFNRPVDLATARQMKEVFLEVIVAPDFEPDAFEALSAKKNLRLVKRRWLNPADRAGVTPSYDLKQVSADLFLLQAVDATQPLDVAGRLQVVSETKPSETELSDLMFAWKVCKHVKSNAIVLAKNGRTVGIGGGQTSRIAALENALKLANGEAEGAVMASDGFLPHTDNVEAAALANIRAIIQPGGSVKDADVIALANQSHMAMVMTGIREFKH